MPPSREVVILHVIVTSACEHLLDGKENMAKTVADQFAETLAAAGVKRVYGIVGDSLNGLTNSLRRQGKIEWIHVRHEEVAAFAAGAEAHLTGELAVCAGSCGPGNLHLINGLFDCHRSRVPVLAIAAQIPSAEIGAGYFQETHPETLFKECSHYCELISEPQQMPRTLEIAIREAVGNRGVSVVVIPGDVALEPASDAPAPKIGGLPAGSARRHAERADLERLAALLNGDGRVTILCGSGLPRRARRAPGARRKAQSADGACAARQGTCRVGQSVRRRHDRPDRLRVRLLRHARLRRAADARHRFPVPPVLSQRGERAHRAGRYAPRADRTARASRSWRRRRRQRDARRAYCRLLKEKRDDTHLAQARDHYAKTRKELDDLAVGKPGKRLIHPQQVAKAISDHAATDAIFTCDVGLPTVWAARYLAMNGKRRLIGSFWHGSMANAMAQAIGAQAAFPDRQVISLSGDGGFTMLMGDFLSLAQLEPAGKGRRVQQRRARLHRARAEVDRFPRPRHRAQEPEFRRDGRGRRRPRHPARGPGRGRRRHRRRARA